MDNKLIYKFKKIPQISLISGQTILPVFLNFSGGGIDIAGNF
jgi:hypothetical protein